jgi:hypothetical protein
VACYEQQKSMYAMDASLANCPILGIKETGTVSSCTKEYAPVCGEFAVKTVGVSAANGTESLIYESSYSRTFSNACEAKAAGVIKYTQGICKSDSVFVDPMDSVKTGDSTNTVCPEIYAPVCGGYIGLTANGDYTYITFPNECTLKAKGAIFKSVGECPSTVKDTTVNVTMCPTNYAPICGVTTVNGLKVYSTYGNECELKKAGAIVKGVGVCPAELTNSGTSSSGTITK